jgi:large subunit ribosomal protein L6
MSRLIKKPIAIPTGVTVLKTDGVVVVEGPKGKLEVRVPIGVASRVDGQNLWVDVEEAESPASAAPKRVSEGKANIAMRGTFWALLKNSVAGVTEGFVKILEIDGVGYRAAVEGKELVLHLGYALPIRMRIEEGVTVAVEKNTIKVTGINKEMVGRVAANIRDFKKPEPYKGKGIHYQGEVIRRKAGKKAGTAAG